MKLLITGALGHIGSKLIHSLKEGQYDQVDLMDNFLTQRYSSLFNLPQRVPFKFISDDINTFDAKTVLPGIDVVIHLAAITDAAGSFAIQDQVEQVNFHGTQRLAQACATFGCKLIFLSTTSVYGVQDGYVDEDCPGSQLRPQSPYAESKLKSEVLLRTMGEHDDLDYVICRFGTIFGTSIGMRFHTAVNKFCWQAATGQPITVWRTALDQKRPYLHLHDAINALKFVIDKDLFDRGIYNVLTTNATVKNIVDEIRDHVPDLSIEYVDNAIMNQLSYEVSNTKFTQSGFQSIGTLKDGITETMRLLQGINHAKSDFATGVANPRHD